MQLRALSPATAARGLARVVRPYLTPLWLVFHVVVFALVVTMVLLGRWQLEVSNRKHFDLQNFSYVLQWWAFSAAALFMWGRIVRYRTRPPKPGELVPTRSRLLALRSPRSVSGGGRMAAPAGSGAALLVSDSTDADGNPIVYRGYVMPQSASRPTRPADAMQASYDDYLWQLALADAAEGHPMPAQPDLEPPQGHSSDDDSADGVDRSA